MADLTEADLDYLRNIKTSPPNAGKSIDPTKPGPDADRIAELEREIAEAEAANEAATGWGAAVGARWECIKGLRAKLARLRDEQPKGDDAALTQWRREPTCFYDGETRPVGNNADEWQVFLESWLDVRDGRVHGTSFVCVQIAEAIDAAEKRGCVFASLAPSPALSTGAVRGQSDAQPVGWQYRWRLSGDSPWSKWTECDRHYALAHAKTEDMELRSLYTAPPDASGLVEAADRCPKEALIYEEAAQETAA